LLAGACAGALLAALYAVTAAPDITWWDAGEFTAAIASFGVPHPPGTPLFVTAGVAIDVLLGRAVHAAQAGVWLAVMCSALAGALLAALWVRWGASRVAAIAIAVTAGAMGTVWANATEVEVYSAALLHSATLLWIGWRAGQDRHPRWFVLLAYVAALAIPLHLSALVALPAACWLARGETPIGARLRGLLPLAPTAMAVAALGVSAVAIMAIRAGQGAWLVQGDPSTADGLLSIVRREQYDVAGLWPRRAPLWLQLANVGQYADWQVALTHTQSVTAAWSRTPLTLLLVLLAVLGARAHWRLHRRSAESWGILLVSATVGVVLLLNLRAGPSFGHGVLPADAVREARERDYFFALAFWAWGAWAASGVAHLLRRWRWATLVLPAALIASNWRARDRRTAPDAALPRDIAAAMLASQPGRTLLFTVGDNDTYPLWAMQAADQALRATVVVVLPLLGADWYAAQVSRRLGIDPTPVLSAGDAAARARALAAPFSASRVASGWQVAVAATAPTSVRASLVPTQPCWIRRGLVDVAAARDGGDCPARVDTVVTAAIADSLARYARLGVAPNPDGMTAVFLRVARCPAALIVATPDGVRTRDALDPLCGLP
jgi:hypothetical protein